MFCQNQFLQVHILIYLEFQGRKSDFALFWNFPNFFIRAIEMQPLLIKLTCIFGTYSAFAIILDFNLFPCLLNKIKKKLSLTISRGSDEKANFSLVSLFIFLQVKMRNCHQIGKSSYFFFISSTSKLMQSHFRLSIIPFFCQNMKNINKIHI